MDNTINEIFSHMDTQHDAANLILLDYDAPLDVEYLRSDLARHVATGKITREEIFVCLDALVALNEYFGHLVAGGEIAPATKARALELLHAWNAFELQRHGVENWQGWEEYSSVQKFLV